ncbi:MAG: LPS export ABC transporter permease LptF [Lysobacter sp.]
MPKLDRYLIGEFAQATFATLLVLLIVSFGAVIADVLGDVASGRVPVGMMLPQLGLMLLRYLPLILPLALMLGMMMAVGRLYRDSEMPVLAAVGVGPRRLLTPVLWVALPVVAAVAACSLWLGPWAERVSKQMINEANRNLIVAGLEPGRFTGLADGGVVFIGSMSSDGSRFRRVFIYRQSDDRLDVTTSDDGELAVDDKGQRFIVLNNGFEVEGPRAGGLDYNLMRYARNEVQLPSGGTKYDPNSPEMLPTWALIGDARREAKAQLHNRIAPPLLTLAFALLAVPLARSTPRQARYGRMLMGFLTYLVGMELMLMGTKWLENGKLAPELGLWWLVLPLLTVATWLYFVDGRLRRPRKRAIKAATA